MPQYVEGMVLTCTHEDCACRVRIESECHCPGVTSESQYTCACGAPLVPVQPAV
jgi:metallothionein